MPRRRGLLGSRFGLLAAAAGTSGLGNGAVAVAFPLLAARLSGDPRVVVGVFVAGRLPWLLFGLLAGVLGDRHDRRRLLLGVEGVRALVLAGYAALVIVRADSLMVLFATAFLIGTGETVFASASAAVLPDLVPPAILAEANGMLYSVQTATEEMAGPALGGWLFGIGAAVPFVLDGGSFALSAVLVALALRHLARSHPPTVERASFGADLRAGIRYVRDSPLLTRLLILITSLAACQAMVLGPLVLFATRTLGLSAAGFGLLIGLTCAGNVVGGSRAGWFAQRYRPAKVITVAALVICVGYLVAGLAPTMVVAAVGLLIEALALAVGNVANMTLRQVTTPAELRARVSGVFRTLITGVMPVGALVGGFVAQGVNLRAPLVVAAVAQLVVVAALCPGLLRLDRIVANSSASSGA